MLFTKLLSSVFDSFLVSSQHIALSSLKKRKTAHISRNLKPAYQNYFTENVSGANMKLCSSFLEENLCHGFKLMNFVILRIVKLSSFDPQRKS